MVGWCNTTCYIIHVFKGLYVLASTGTRDRKMTDYKNNIINRNDDDKTFLMSVMRTKSYGMITADINI